MPSATVYRQLGQFIPKTDSPHQGSRTALGPILPRPSRSPLPPVALSHPASSQRAPLWPKSASACLCCLRPQTPRGYSSQPRCQCALSHTPRPPSSSENWGSPFTITHRGERPSERKIRSQSRGCRMSLKTSLTGPHGFEAQQKANGAAASSLGPGACHLGELKIKAPF